MHQTKITTQSLAGRAKGNRIQAQHAGVLYFTNAASLFVLLAFLLFLVACSSSPQQAEPSQRSAPETVPVTDPEEELIGIIMAQVRPNRHLTFRRQFQALTYAAIVE